MIPEEPDNPAAPEQLMLFIQSMRGAPASVLLALAVTGRFMSHQELRLWTRCGKNQISDALRSLVVLGWAVGRTSRGPWMLARDLRPAAGDFPSEGIPLKGLSSSSDSLNHPREGTILLSPLRREMIEALRACGIREPTASELVELPHMTPAYLQAHVQAARAHGLRIGSAIMAMRLGAPPPHAPTPKNRQSEVDEMVRRFQEGR